MSTPNKNVANKTVGELYAGTCILSTVLLALGMIKSGGKPVYYPGILARSGAID
jgi:hypothetical protein